MNKYQEHTLEGMAAQDKTARCESVPCDRVPKSERLCEAAHEMKGVIAHIKELKINLGIYEEDKPKSDGMVKGQGGNDLLNVLNELPGQISMDCSELHSLINDIQSSLI